MRAWTTGLAMCLLPLLGCTAELDEPLGETKDAVFGGDTVASSRTAVVLVETATVRCGGVAVGPRTVLAVDPCVGPDAVIRVTPIGSTPIAVVNTIQGPTVPIPGGETIGFAAYEVDMDLPVDPVSIGPAPAMGATLTLAGYGTPTGVSDRSEGTITVDSVATDTFTATGVEACVSDSGAFDAQDRLVGLGYFGEFTVNGCRDPITYFKAEELAGLVGGGVGGGGGSAATGSGGAGGGATTSAGVGGGATSGGGTVDPVDDDGGCGCRTAGGDEPSGGALAALLLLGAFGTRRRRAF